MTELKQCPFCGGKADFEESNTYYDKGFVYCTECGAASQWGPVNEVVSLWNARAERTCERGEEFWECTSCGVHGLRDHWNYCPNCGAKVIEGNHKN